MTQDARLWAQDSLRHSLAAFAMYACIHGAQILGVVTESVSQSANQMGSSHPAKKRRLLALTSGRPEVASASAVQPSVPPDALLDPAIPIWTIRPSHEQPLSMEFELTHMRPVPLPFAIDLVIEGKRYACMYCGHGQSKVVYRVLTATTTKWVLKLTARMDTEPYVCQKLSAVCGAAQPASKICPAIHGIGRHAKMQMVWMACGLCDSIGSVYPRSNCRPRGLLQDGSVPTS